MNAPLSEKLYDVFDPLDFLSFHIYLEIEPAGKKSLEGNVHGDEYLRKLGYSIWGVSEEVLRKITSQLRKSTGNFH